MENLDCPQIASNVFKLASFGDLAGLKSYIAESAEDGLKEALDIHGRSPLHWAAASGHTEMVNYLVDECEIDVNCTDKFGLTPVSHASRAGKEDMVALLVGKSADVSIPDESGNTALHYACSRGILGMVQKIIEAGANIDHANKGGNTALHISARNGQLVLVRYLAKTGAKLGLQDISGDTALHIASAVGFKIVVEALLQAGASATPGAWQLTMAFLMTYMFLPPTTTPLEYFLMAMLFRKENLEYGV